jgi:hypothetical protein
MIVRLSSSVYLSIIIYDYDRTLTDGHKVPQNNYDSIIKYD